VRPYHAMRVWQRDRITALDLVAYHLDGYSLSESLQQLSLGDCASIRERRAIILPGFKSRRAVTYTQEREQKDDVHEIPLP